MTRAYNYRILGLFLFIIFSWGLSWPVTKIGLNYLSPVWYTVYRLLVGTATMMLFVAYIKKLSFPQKQDWPIILVIGLLDISLYILLANIGLSYLPPGHSSLLAYTTPLWVMPIAILFFKESGGLLRWLGFGLGTSGLVILMSPWELDWSNHNVLFGSSMLLLASLCWAISMLCVRYMRWTKPPLELIPWQLLVGTLPILLFALVKEPIIALPTWNNTLVLSLIYSGAIVTGISYWSGVVINKALPTTVLSLGFLLVPVCSLAISASFMHEIIQTPTMIAMGLILTGLVCVAANQHN